MTTLNDCTLPLRQKDVCVTSKFRDIPIQFSDFLSFREFLRFRLARSERNAVFWLASANPLRRQSSRTRTQPFTSSARLSHCSGWWVGAGAGMAKIGWKAKNFPRYHERKKETKKTTHSLSYFWKCFFKMLFPNSFVLASLSLCWRREGVCGGALVIKRASGGRWRWAHYSYCHCRNAQFPSSYWGTQRERERVCVCACAPNGDDNWSPCSISLTHSFLPHTLWQYCSETRVSKTEVYLRRIKW